MKILLLCLFLVSCGKPDCPEHEKVQDGYYCYEIEDATICDSIMRCPG